MFWLFILRNYLALKKQDLSIPGRMAAIWKYPPWIFLHRFSWFRRFLSKRSKSRCLPFFIYRARYFNLWVLVPIIYALILIKKNRQFWPFSGLRALWTPPPRVTFQNARVGLKFSRIEVSTFKFKLTMPETYKQPNYVNYLPISLLKMFRLGTDHSI